MTALRVLAARVKALLAIRRSDTDLQDDIDAHLDLLVQEHLQRGHSPADARAAARRAFGGLDQMKEAYRDQRGFPALDALGQDLRYALRMLRRAPGVTAVAVLSLGIGIGAATSAFSVLNAVMLRPLPVAEASRLVLMQPLRRGDRFPLFNPAFETVRARQQTLTGLFAVNDRPFLRISLDGAPGGSMPASPSTSTSTSPGTSTTPSTATAPAPAASTPVGPPEYVRASAVSGNYFDLLGLAPAAGRLLSPHDDLRPDDGTRASGDDDAVLSSTGPTGTTGGVRAATTGAGAAAIGTATAPAVAATGARTPAAVPPPPPPPPPPPTTATTAPTAAAAAAPDTAAPTAAATSAADSTCAAVISFRYWQRRFAQQPDALGRRLHLIDRDCIIVGVAPDGFESHQPGYAPDLWLPLRPLTDRALLDSSNMAFFSGIMGRLAPGVDRAQAEADLTTQYQQVQTAQLAAAAATRGAEAAPNDRRRPPDRPEDFRLRVVPGAQGVDAVRQMFARPLTLAFAVVCIVLLIAIANVANLLLARGAVRLPELATRAALGAGRGRLVRQLATEGALLALLGGLLGLALSMLAAPWLASFVSLGYTTIAVDASADARVLLMTAGATLLAALFSGVLPALRLSETTLRDALSREGRVHTGQGQRLTRTLVVAQLALSLVLVGAAGLLLRTLAHLSAIDPGFRPDRVVMLEVRDETPGSSFGRVDSPELQAQRAALYRTLDERLNALPGVRAASLSWLGLFSANDLALGLIDPDRPDQRAEGHVDYVSSRYFDTMGMQMLRGRGFTMTDRDDRPRVAVANETLARTRFGGVDQAIGRRLALDYRGETARPFTIVGVVRDSKYNSLRETRTQPMLWVPIAQMTHRVSSVAVRTEAGMEAAIAREMRGVLASTVPMVMVRKQTTLSAEVATRTTRERLLLGLSGGFGALAVLLAAVGVYGTLAFAVSRRTREIGVRLAFGAARGTVLRLILRDAVRLVALAILVGLPLTLGAGYALRALLFGVTPFDPLTMVSAAALLAAVALVAAWLPARRAASVDPLVALRAD